MAGNKCDLVIGAKCLIVQRKCSFSELHLNGSADKPLFGLCGMFSLPCSFAPANPQLEGFFQV